MLFLIFMFLIVLLFDFFFITSIINYCFHTSSYELKCFIFCLNETRIILSKLNAVFIGQLVFPMYLHKIN